MIDIETIFKNRVMNPARLLEYGFVRQNGAYLFSSGLEGGQFEMTVFVQDTGCISVQVMDRESNEEYVLVHVRDAEGAFVNALVQLCENKLKEIADNCFDFNVFKALQTKQVIAYAEKTYNSCPEFLWKKLSDNAVLRRKDSNKWFAVLLKVPASKLGLRGETLVEIVDLRALPEEVASLTDGKTYFPGYHMNKKHWYTICLNGSVPMEEICERVDKSYSLAYK